MISSLLLASCSIAQTTMSVEEFGQYKKNNNNLPTTLREVNDVNNFFNSYIGDWRAIYNGKEYELHVFEEREYTEAFNLRMDILNFSYIIKDVNTGDVLANSSNRVLGEAYGIKYQPDSGLYEFHMSTGCGESKSILLGFTTSELSLNGQNDDRMAFAAFDSWLNRPATSGRYQSYSHLIPDVAIRFERM